MKTVIGIDYGSDSVRAVLVDTEGHELAASVFNYPRWADGLYSDAATSRFRQHPLDYLEGLEAVVRGVLKEANAADVAGIGVDATGATPTPVDRDGRALALRPDFAEEPDAMFVLWKDHTSVEEADRINEIAHNLDGVDYTMYSGGIYSSEWFWSKALHILRVSPKVRAATWKFVEHCEWIVSLLTGLPVKASRAPAGHKAMWHPSWGGLPPEAFFTAVDPLLSGMRARMYTDTFTSDIPAGKLSPYWAQKLGLSTEVIVATGAFDAHAGAVGAGLKEGVQVKIIGTSTCDIIGARNVDHCIKGVCGQVDGSAMPDLTCIEAGQCAFGDIYAWFRRFLGYAGNVDWARLEADAMALAPNETLALDWMNGRRTPDANYRVRGALFGLSLGTTPPMVYRALVEATAFGARAIADRLASEGVRVTRTLATGGIAKKSPFVMQTLADVLNMPIEVVRSTQTCALGTAIYAATAAGLFPDANAAAAAIASPIETRYVPQRNYDQAYRRYSEAAYDVEKRLCEDREGNRE